MGNRKIYRQIAKKYGVSPKEVKTEMQAALNTAWTQEGKTPSQAAKQAQIPSKGAVPTTDEFLDYIRKSADIEMPS